MDLYKTPDNKWYSAIALALLVFACYICHLGLTLPNLMEARNFVTAREMTEFGNWLLPTMNGEPRFAKPPLPTWLTAFVIMFTGDAQDLFTLRLPAVFAASVLIFSVYLFVFNLTSSRRTAFYSSAILCTSVMMLQMARIGSWDIHCHTWMIAALAAWTSIQPTKNKVLPVALTIVFLSLSFYSKGPVSFYTLLLPFIISTFLVGRSTLESMPWLTIVMLVLSVGIISFAWPYYVSINAPEVGQEVVKAETSAWLNRHVKPFYFYLNFPLFMGIWIPFSLASLFLFWRFRNEPNFRFVFWMTITSLVLLSVIPEKKDRYLLPMIVPLSIICGMCFKSLREASELKVSKTVFGVQRALLILCSVLLLGAGLYFGFVTNSVGTALAVAAIVSSILLLIYVLKWSDFDSLFAQSIFAVLIFNLFLLPATTSFLYPNKNYRSMSVIWDHEEMHELDVYSTNDLNLVYIYDIGKRVKTIEMNKPGTFPESYPAAVISIGALEPSLPDQFKQNFSVREIDIIDPSTRKSEWLYHLSIVDKK